jgi:hypothetical protein
VSQAGIVIRNCRWISSAGKVNSNAGFIKNHSDFEILGKAGFEIGLPIA